MRRGLAITGVVVLVLLVVIVLTIRSDRGSWSDGETHGRWTVMYTGYGSVIGDDREVVIEPRPADADTVTHGGLVHTAQPYLDPDFEVSVRTEAQVRLGTPNPWEVGWVLWNLRDTDHFYAVVLKPNGWEVSKQDPAYPGSQRFIATGADRLFPVGGTYRVRVEHDWPRMTVSVDGRELATIVDDERPYRGGAIGLYTEDARVRFSDLHVIDSAHE